MADSCRNDLRYPRMLTIPSPNLKHNDKVRRPTTAVDDNMERIVQSTFNEELQKTHQFSVINRPIKVCSFHGNL
jgi:hypothetical protein